jgi:hypothetical protein
MMRKLSPIIIAFALVIFSLTPPPAQGGAMSEKQAKEYRLKAAYLLNFAKFISWPNDAFTNPQSPFVIGILGDNPFGKALNPLTLRKVRNRTIELRYFANIGEIEPCQMLFVSRSEKDSIPAILAACRDMPTFTISDIKDFIHQDGMLEFITIKGHLRFSINLLQAQKHGLEIEAQLLALATEVIKVKP